MEIYRQGDVMLIKVRRLPMEAKKEKSNSDQISVAEGKTLAAKCACVWNAGAERFIQVMEQTTLEGNSPLKLDSGVYRVVLRGRHASKEIEDLFPRGRKAMVNNAAKNFAMYGYKKAA